MLNIERKDNGFDHIQYHFVIRRDGTIQEVFLQHYHLNLIRKNLETTPSTSHWLVIDAPTGTEPQ